MSKPSKKSLRRKADKLWAELVRKRAGGKCERCGKEGRLEAHHIISRSKYPTRWNLENGLALCHACHMWFHQNPIEAADWVRDLKDVERLKEESKKSGKPYDYERIIKLLEEKKTFSWIEGKEEIW